jgi:hypothetical protein
MEVIGLSPAYLQPLTRPSRGVTLKRVGARETREQVAKIHYQLFCDARELLRHRQLF